MQSIERFGPEQCVENELSSISKPHRSIAELPRHVQLFICGVILMEEFMFRVVHPLLIHNAQQSCACMVSKHCIISCKCLSVGEIERYELCNFYTLGVSER